MRKKNVDSKYIHTCITEALIQLMEEKPFCKISISEITEKAGVSRASFYRHYNSKEQIITDKINYEAKKWWYSFDPSTDKTNQTNYIMRMFHNALSMKDLGTLMYKNNLSYLLMDALYELLGPREGDDDILTYEKSSLVGATFGILNEWVKRGMVETPEEMASLIPTSLVKSALIPYFPIFEVKPMDIDNEI